MALILTLCKYIVKKKKKRKKLYFVLNFYSDK